MAGSDTLVSFIVPTKNSARTIEACLKSIRQQLDGPIELVVVDNSSTDGTDEIARSLADVFITQGPERSAQRNAGAQASSGAIVVFIDSDMVLPPGLASEIRNNFEDAQVQTVVFPESVATDTFWLKCRNLEKHLYDNDDSVEAGRAFRRETFERVGGYDLTLTGPEDWELPDRVLRTVGGIRGRTVSRIFHDEAGLTPWLNFKKKRYYGYSVGKFLSGGHDKPVSRTVRPQLLKRSLLTLPRHPILVTGMLFLKAVEFAGISVGAIAGRRSAAPYEAPSVERVGAQSR